MLPIDHQKGSPRVVVVDDDDDASNTNNRDKIYYQKQWPQEHLCLDVRASSTAISKSVRDQTSSRDSRLGQAPPLESSLSFRSMADGLSMRVEIKPKGVNNHTIEYDEHGSRSSSLKKARRVLNFARPVGVLNNDHPGGFVRRRSVPSSW
ncbi:hypothetical protein BBP40_011851 [Aspergillus hancockii]|nr:hypothetical protein BBP40_011851 [Aspergillus hancockii]